MAVPRNRTSKSKKRSRSAHSALKSKGVSLCSNCQKTKMPHTVCPYCGFYAKRSGYLSREKAEK